MSKDAADKKNIEDAEIIISKTLRAGVAISATITCVGLVLFILTGDSGYPGETFPTSVREIIKGLVVFKPYAVMLSGLLILMLTPVLRVGVSIVTFIKEKDYMYASITVTVFLILIISFLLGRG
ncbi:DUF1634 domain-containing protein [Lacrimispora algidixylanolytica]|uniref:DUF1634 domain-containing protein n=1 Tax=Lacrimispora algidixylanolytica TaxID=94868 RepID=A0A419SUQ7_9FIRM|nr:DUF1634 domain-containing protein [Lacrimispora algidixylanolytica]RKD28949.1 hypothetical protein BET01_09435 [Lacrimispora algidixylanolytica]